MTEQEYAAKLQGTSVPHQFDNLEGKPTLHCLDLTQIPGADRKYFDEQGYWKTVEKKEKPWQQPTE